ncbi:MAG: hypothetical protein NTW86_26815 [Candidatus Sumerlaeota bacterium]|nr:hypothetical protein [Candidatus Sumerlaeota bacterium]
MAPIGQWIVVGLSALGVLGLSYVGMYLFSLALLAAPFIMGLSAWAFLAAPKRLALPVLGGVCAIVAASDPNTACFTGAAVLCGFLLPTFMAHRPGEDGCYHLIPLVFLGIVAAALFAAGRASDDAGWRPCLKAFQDSVAEARGIQRDILARMPLSPEETSRWQEADRLLPYRATGVGAAAIGIVFYTALAWARRWLSPVPLLKNRFAHFRISEGYLGFLIAGLGLMAVWVARPWPWLGHAAYGLLFFAVGGLLLEAVSLAVFFASREERRGAPALAVVAAVVALAIAPVLAVPAAAAGLADVWLDFRHLDRVLEGVRE